MARKQPKNAFLKAVARERANMSPMDEEKQKRSKYRRRCKLPSCRKWFGTNREWQEFHHPDCQKKWQRLLRRSREETIVELELLKEKTKRIIKAIELSTISIKDLEENVKKIIKTLGIK